MNYVSEEFPPTSSLGFCGSARREDHPRALAPGFIMRSFTCTFVYQTFA